MEKSTLTSAGAVVTASLASLCCVGPLLAVIGVAGLGSAGSVFSVFEPYRPFFIGLTAIFLGIGFFMTYRNRADTCEEGDACATPAPLKMRKIGLWSIAGLSGLMLAVPYLPLSTMSSVPVADASLATTVLTLEGMT